MRTLLLALLIASMTYMSWNRITATFGSGPERLHETSYVVVYGRDTCGITSRMRSDLSRRGIPHEYKRVDEPGVGDELHPRMRAAGLDTGRYGLPVVDVNAEMMIRPDAELIADRYREYAQANEASPTRGESGGGDPLTPCMIDSEETLTLRSQCQNPAG